MPSDTTSAATEQPAATEQLFTPYHNLTDELKMEIWRKAVEPEERLLIVEKRAGQRDLSVVASDGHLSNVQLACVLANQVVGEHYSKNPPIAFFTDPLRSMERIYPQTDLMFLRSERSGLSSDQFGAKFLADVSPQATREIRRVVINTNFIRIMLRDTFLRRFPKLREINIVRVSPRGLDVNNWKLVAHSGRPIRAILTFPAPGSVSPYSTPRESTANHDSPPEITCFHMEFVNLY